MSDVRRSGSFHYALPLSSHCCSTSSTCVGSTTPARSTFPSETTCASVPRTGPSRRQVTRSGHGAGGADRLRDPVRELVAATRAEPGPQPVSRRSERRRVDLAAVPDVRVSRAARSPPGSGPRARGVDGEDDVLLASRSRRSSSSSPSTRGAVPDDVLVVHQVGMPGIAAVGKGSASTARASCCGGGGPFFPWSALYASLIGRRAPRRPRSRRRRSRQRRREVQVVDRDLEGARRAYGVGERPRGVLGRLTPSTSART